MKSDGESNLSEGGELASGDGGAAGTFCFGPNKPASSRLLRSSHTHTHTHTHTQTHTHVVGDQSISKYRVVANC